MNVGGLMYDILAIQNKWVNKLVWLRRRVIVRAVQRTLLSLFPFALLGSIARILLINPLSDKNEIETTLAMLPKRANGNKDSKVRCTALTMTRRRSQTNLLTHLFWIAKMSYIKPPTFIS